MIEIIALNLALNVMVPSVTGIALLQDESSVQAKVITSESDDFDASDPLAVHAAIRLLRDGQTEKALYRLRKLGESGRPEAFYHLGEIYRLGASVPSNPEVSQMYYGFAAHMGHVRSALTYANVAYFEGPDVAGTGEAVALWQQYALQGEPEALFMMGLLLWNGEAGLVQDPVRGYGLVWRAADMGFTTAIQSELEMADQLSFEAKQKARTYARNLASEGFGEGPLALDLVFEGIERPDGMGEPRIEPENWRRVWRLDVGFHLPKTKALELRAALLVDLPEVVGALALVLEPALRQGVDTGKFQLVAGPFTSLQEAVSHCVLVKRQGYECFARAPSDTQ